MYTIDASVWVNAFDQRESGHAISRQLLNNLRDRDVPIFVPNLLLIEVAGAISRTRGNPTQAEAFAESLSHLPHVTVLTLDPTMTERAMVLASQNGLRGADAVYGAVAEQVGTTLITLDNEQLNRLSGTIPTLTPAAGLRVLERSMPP